jgi:hypothetical protein
MAHGRHFRLFSYCKCKHPEPLALDNLTNNFGIKFFLALTKEKDERKCSLALGRQGWRLGLLCSRKLSLRDNPFIQSIIEEDFITKWCHSVPPGYL